uniref:FAS1 domain-containing protein n=1 Tax=Pseudo-nitzschia australis TaxID=44445 RepID=A0A7S4EQY0_9STRA|mmetsp:Transcript_2368/g.5110  ORF Transcript_2368/g.5110 Transcript_2368/m.5110 type:complete len:643 (+) Transcript_2368:154-2082(+)|eukprot:CAMPEP_0168193586 /NCGR_PEP_ID=MMETSP0139_2-20121125/18689_1 /TAXON_ID=44445 /ORGANISM="Pseudo-nitzschia australis, Strain 10249 10 AB" /LENGTH=642 /DNA_ID=CAMNT_0008116959 /DNA_START=42 /DNA_END=1970 /DNA_ORIENTATION=-
MTKRNVFFHRVVSLLLLLVGETASATLVKRDNIDSNRDLIGFHQIVDLLIPSPPTMYPTATAPTPFPVKVPQANQPMNSNGSPPTFPPTTTAPEAVVEESTDGTQYRVNLPVVPGAPTKFPSPPPTPFPTRRTPSATPSLMPSVSSRPSISMSPTVPSESPSLTPSEAPTSKPSSSPSAGQSAAPSSSPSVAPSEAPDIPPTNEPSDEPSNVPTLLPSDEPSVLEPLTEEPSASLLPSDMPTEDELSDEPSAESLTEESSLSPSPTEVSSIESSIFTTAPPSSVSTDNIEGIGVAGRLDFGKVKGGSISEIICDVNNADTWGSLCVALKESNLFETLGGTSKQYTLFAPTNDAFEIGDYPLDTLFQDRTSLRNLLSTHIVPVALPYSALLCNLNTEMLNFDVTYTVCIGGVKFQTSDGNEMRNLPVITDPEDVQTANGIIHSVSNLIIPFEFSMNNSVVEEPPENNIATNNQTIDEESLNATEIMSDEFEESDIDLSTPSNDITNGINNQTFDEGSLNASSILSDDLKSDDSEEKGNDMGVADTSSEVSTSMPSLITEADTEHTTDRTGDLDDIGFGCQVCESRELCAIPRTAVMQFPGEGQIPCINVVDRQNTDRLNMLPSFCKEIQEQFKKSCLIQDEGN